MKDRFPVQGENFTRFNTHSSNSRLITHVAKAGTKLFFTVSLLLFLISPVPTNLASAHPAGGTASKGTIAYIRNYQELHLIQPDGSNDLTIFTAPKVGDVQSAIEYTSWRPDGTEIAFASDMAQTMSLLQSDIFAIKPDGSGLRQITDPPLNSELDSFQTGSVAVHVTNENLTDSLFIIYVQGARQAQQTTVPAGTSKTVTFNNVAIFPNEPQFPVAINGITRWIGTPDTPTFQPGQTNTATIDISSFQGYDNFGAALPVWQHDSHEIDYHLSDACIGEGISSNPTPGSQWGDQLVQYSANMCYISRGPTSDTADQIVYWDYQGNSPDGGFMEATKGASQATLLFDTGYGGFMYGLDWLPDGTGFLFSFDDGSSNSSNIYAYDFSSQQVTQLTDFNGQYAAKLSISPDGQQVAFELYNIDPNPLINPDAVPDLWLMNIDGSGAGLFLQNASDPAWGAPQQAPPPPPPSSQYELYLPFLDR